MKKDQKSAMHLIKRTLFLLCISIISSAITFPNNAFSQIDCSTASGILALMSAPVAINPTATVGSTTVTARCTTKIFNAAQTTTPASCVSAIKMYVFYSTVQTNLTGLPSLASQAQFTTLFAKPNKLATISATTVANEKSCVASIPRSGFKSGATVYYRWAKYINHPTDVDPMVWSSIQNFTNTTPPPPPPPPACTNPDLKPAPANSNDITVFKALSGSWSDSIGNTYIQTAGIWCKDFFDGSGLIVAGTVIGTDRSIGEMRQLTITLPPLTWGVRETNNRAVATAFNNSLFRSGEATAIANFNVATLAAGATANAPAFTARGTRTVFLFPLQNNACAVRTFDHVQGNLNVNEKDYVVKVDTGNTVTECNDASSDNQRTYSNSGGTTVVFPH